MTPEQQLTPMQIAKIIADLMRRYPESDWERMIDCYYATDDKAIKRGIRTLVKHMWKTKSKMSHFDNHTKFELGDRVRKTKGSDWRGRVVGFYSTDLNPEGYCVESDAHPGSVQIYPAAALEPWSAGASRQ